MPFLRERFTKITAYRGFITYPQLLEKLLTLHQLTNKSRQHPKDMKM